MAGRFRPRAIGSDTIPLERLPPAEAAPSLPVHSLLLVERGVHIIEILNLEEIAQKQVSVFAFFLSPLKIVGATGVPAGPLAVRARRKT
jgi:kynurenine formamidase